MYTTNVVPLLASARQFSLLLSCVCVVTSVTPRLTPHNVSGISQFVAPARPAVIPLTNSTATPRSRNHIASCRHARKCTGHHLLIAPRICLGGHNAASGDG